MDNTIVTEEQKDRGFTLVELLIVIVILGILATVTVFAVRGITDQGQESSCSATAKTLETAIESYYAQEGVYPANAAALTTVDPPLLRSAPANYDTDGNGAVVLSPDNDTNPCFVAP